MTTAILENPFVGKTKQPTPGEVSKALGKSKSAWNQLLQELKADLAITEEVWHSYSPKAGWALKVNKGKRTILYMSPRTEFFLVSFVLGGKALKAALADDLPREIAQLVREGKKYPEGTAVRITVDSTTSLDAIKKIAAAKMQN